MATTINDYIARFPQDTQAALHALRQTLAAAMPQATESISYGIPTYKLHGVYVAYFAGFKKHVSIYPLSSQPDFENEVAPYRSGRATLKFTLNAAMPLTLMAKIATFMVAENARRVASRKDAKN